jgi:hypothetical protein
VGAVWTTSLSGCAPAVGKLWSAGLTGAGDWR